MLDEWKTTVAAELAKTKSLLDRARLIAGGAGCPPQTKQLFDDAKYNYDFVTYAKGVHNIEYALNLLKYSDSVFVKVAGGK
jgi:hypothetical protein